MKDYEIEYVFMAYEDAIREHFCEACECPKWDANPDKKVLNGCAPNCCSKWVKITDAMRRESEKARKRVRDNKV